MKSPRTKPSASAGTASRSVPPAKAPRPIKPCPTRKPQLRSMTPKSMLVFRCGRADHSGNGEAPLDARHHARDRETENQINQRARREGLDRLRGVGFDLARLECELGDADRERDGRIL